VCNRAPTFLCIESCSLIDTESVRQRTEGRGDDSSEKRALEMVWRAPATRVRLKATGAVAIM
jgi:hypothetical protein